MLSYCKKFFFIASNILKCSNGNFGVLSALVAVPVIAAAGLAVDISNARDRQTQAQTLADAAALAAAAKYTSGVTQSEQLSSIASSYLVTGSDVSMRLLRAPYLSADGGSLCIDVASDVGATLMQIVGIRSTAVSVVSCAVIGSTSSNVEIALVLDVSSSMIEEGRFAPMQEAVKSFLAAFPNNGKAKISIVPFSSRISVGMERTDWLKAYGGDPAVPARWTNPLSVHKTATISKWLDGTTNLAKTSSNYYWMGCIEPRADVEMKDSGSVSSASLGDNPPQTKPFVPMDSNDGSGKSFCPPPITPLTSDINYLQGVISNMTSQGSTRLDVGIVGGWYTLSPKWRSAWDGIAPVDYGGNTKKILVFMTDGQMNVKYGPTEADKLDWICYNDRTDSCNDIALDAFLKTCASIKSAGITIYTVSYSPDADTSNLRKCASSSSYALSASTASIKQIYASISKDIVTAMKLRLTK
ncbi:pilus assembly protein TadG-related protein [Rhizobium lemnae]|uniref:Pilus assembly protein TadG-related protein n=1 Tax=Rhizobium lemnae TaxID=1214924 RepID=A0ABV8ECZ3_9HYPH|nr:pilus assembly protein TadG-related protein [Rhizobium lemnae]MCJ8507011.1 pilus assembly protein TadG-related protein [Rhizobium lemnae]